MPPITIDGQTRLMGVLGEGIAYTRSPALHNCAARALGINAVYLPLSMPAAQVRPFLEAAWTMGAVGFNVTTPHKALVAALVPNSGLASTNTLYRGESGWRAASTDGEGFARAIRRMDGNLAACAEVVILGSGGVVAAIVSYLATLPVRPNLVIFRRRADGDEGLRALWPKEAAVQFQDLSLAALSATLAKYPKALLVQATSAPHHGDDLSELCPALTGFTGMVCDLVYGRPSRLYHEAKAGGLKVQDGLPMLIEQARLAQQLWWGKAASYDELAAAITA